MTHLIKGRSRVRRANEPHLKNKREMPKLLPVEVYAARMAHSVQTRKTKRQFIALIIPGYNEEMVIEHTILSAIAAGLSASHIFVVDDNSSDTTAAIARRILGKYNVLTVPRSGKGLAVHRAVETFKLTERYRWIHIADADGEFDSRYFTVLRRDLRVKNAAATGYVSSLKTSLISEYRAFEYTIGMEFVRRFQSIAGVISIIPGPTSIFRSDIFGQLSFNANALCEDFDVTLQIHRQNLGSIQFIPQAIARTQDPATFKDFIKQITRWNRGVIQMIFKHRIGSRATKIDAYLTAQLFQNIFFFFVYAIWIPYVTISTGDVAYLAFAFIADVLAMFGYVLFAALLSKRWDTLAAFPIIYGLRWVSVGVFMRAFVEVGLLKRYRLTKGVWETVTRQQQNHALKEGI